MTTSEKTKVLVLSDAPSGSTGFSRVSRNILKDLHATGLYDITVIGISYDGAGYDREKYPYLIIPATSGLNPRYNDLYGRQRCLDELSTGQFKIFFTIQDMAVIKDMVKPLTEMKKKFKFKTVMYIPVDSNLDTKPEWVTEVLPVIDYPVAYTEFAKKEIQKFTNRGDIRVCLHGVESEEFKPVDIDKKKVLNDFFFLSKPFADDASVDKRLILINVNRNQIRKDYLRTFQIVKAYKDEYPEDNILLLAVAQIKDQGGDLQAIAKQCGLEYGVDWTTPKDYQVGITIPTNMLNLWYNCADYVFSTTLGEGFGLSSIEGMAAGIPVIFPKNTALIEILGKDEERGLLMDCGVSTEDFITMGAYDSSLVRPRTSIQSALNTIDHAESMKEETGDRRSAALEWAREHDWCITDEFWIDLFAEVASR